jgi:hypothetical protein
MINSRIVKRLGAMFSHTASRRPTAVNETAGVRPMHHLRPICARCVYWVEDHTSPTNTVGHCHRYPPGIYVNQANGVVIQKFPTTDRHHWCGEWSADDTKLMQGVRNSLADTATRHAHK